MSLTNTPVQAKCLLPSLKYAARGIDLSMNSAKTEFMYFKQESATINDKPLKPVDHFTYLSSNISSTESNVDIYMDRGVMVVVVGKTRVQILDETDSISHSTNTLGKGMNPIILPPAMGK